MEFLQAAVRRAGFTHTARWEGVQERSFHGLGLGRISTLSGCLLTCQAGG